jgi:sugar phosphate permease
LVAIAVGLGLANGPASSASTAAVPADDVGQASGISNMARYVGGSLAVAAAASVYTAVTESHRAAGESAADALASGFSRTALLLAIMSACGITLALLMGRHRVEKADGLHRVAAAAAASSHTLPIPAAVASSEA